VLLTLRDAASSIFQLFEGIILKKLQSFG